MDKATCKIDGCERPRFNRGWCAAHWNRVRRNGDPGSPYVQGKRRGCLVDDCGARHFGNGYCQTHAYRLRTHGDPLTVLPSRPLSGEQSSMWQGEDIQYAAIHRRLGRMRGKALEQACVSCDGPAAEWAYIHDSVGELVDDRGRRYSADIKDYQPMCCPCHRRYDNAARSWLAQT